MFQRTHVYCKQIQESFGSNYHTVGRGVVTVRAAHTIRNVLYTVQSILGQNGKGLIVQSMFPCSQSNGREQETEKK